MANSVQNLLSQWGLASNFDPNAAYDSGYGMDPLGFVQTYEGPTWDQGQAVYRRSLLRAAMEDEKAAANPYSALTHFGPIWGTRIDPGMPVQTGDGWATAPATAGSMDNAAMIEQIARQLNIDPQIAIAAYKNAVHGTPNTSLFAGATDVNNQHLRPGWAIADMLQQTGNYTPEYANWLNQWVDQGNVAKDEQNARDKADFNKSLMKFGLGLTALVTPGLLGMYPGQGGMSVFGSDAALGAAGESVSGGAVVGGQAPMDWTSMIGPAMDSSVVGSAVPGFDLASAGMFPLSGTTAFTTAPTFVEGGGFWDSLLKGSKTLGSLLGGGSGGMNLDLGGLLGGGIDLAAGLAPSLAAISYAKNQGPFDTSRLESVYGSLAPQTFEYDMNTQRGLDQLTNSLSRRGVMGSSFANADLANFNTVRELGRNDLVARNALAQGGIAGDILNAQVKERLLKNDLYGRALSSIGTALGGRR